MKRVLLVIIAVTIASIASAQKAIVVDSEKIFKSIDEYNTALSTLDALAKQYQTIVDSKFKQVENLYNNYMAQKATLTATICSAREQQILEAENQATKYQESVFGNEGIIMKKRIELIQPIQSRVFAAIESYAKLGGYDIVIDKASNATLLYNSAEADHTEAIISLLKK